MCPRCSQCESKLWRGAQYEDALEERNVILYGSEMHCQGAFGLGLAKVKKRIFFRRNVKLLSVKSNAIGKLKTDLRWR